ncbi:hypothetical protein [Jannaschia formosa]|uniref:hypothetical protein n=1 Tax=Jannaschia formosa TaxID=2259592 RepID=UPI0010751A10|nr:hypothetical protein [Jannaschia formosa]TFL16893.1 hypothetical protein DR046_17320 [Jannaschia formosa]
MKPPAQWEKPGARWRMSIDPMCRPSKSCSASCISKTRARLPWSGTGSSRNPFPPFGAGQWPAAPVGRPSGQAPVCTMELLGDSTMVTVRAGRGLVVVKAPKEFRTKIRAPFSAHVPVSICHLFDAKTGERLTA